MDWQALVVLAITLLSLIITIYFVIIKHVINIITTGHSSGKKILTDIIIELAGYHSKLFRYNVFSFTNRTYSFFLPQANLHTDHFPNVMVQHHI